MDEIERRWDRESWYRRPDGRLDWLALEGYLIAAILVLAVAAGLAGVFVAVLDEAVKG